MSSIHLSFIEANVPTRSFGSDHDTALDGVTRGLQTLFPPVHQHASQGDDPLTLLDEHEA